MNDNGQATHEWHPPGSCESNGNGRKSKSVPKPEPAHEPKPYNLCQLSNKETSLVLAAYVEVEKQLEKRRPELQSTCREVLHGYHQAGLQFDALWGLESDDAPAESLPRQLPAGSAGSAGGGVDGVDGDVVSAVERARGIRRTFEDSEASGGPVRSWTMGLLAGLSLVAAAIFDAWYFADVFRKLLDAPDTGFGVRQALAFLPGFLLAMALLVSGRSLARPAKLWYLRREGRPGSDSLPRPIWLPSLVFLLPMLGIFGLWAYLRAKNGDTGGDYEPLPVALLLVMLTITAIAMKVIAYNPLAEQDKATRKAVSKAKRRLRWARRRTVWGSRVERWRAGAAGRVSERNRARRNQRQRERRQSLLETVMGSVVDHAGAANRLQGLLFSTVDQAKAPLVSAFEHIMRLRSQHGLAGDVSPPFARSLVEPADIVVDADVPELQNSFKIFECIDMPQLDLSVLHYARNVLISYGPHQLRGHWDSCWQSHAHADNRTNGYPHTDTGGD